jgi:hypothetical protein
MKSPKSQGFGLFVANYFFIPLPVAITSSNITFNTFASADFQRPDMSHPRRD